MPSINSSVGRNGVNAPDDAKVVQRLLNLQDLAPLQSLTVDGQVGDLTIGAIRHFQEKIVGLKHPDGLVEPGGRSWRALTAPRREGERAQPGGEATGEQAPAAEQGAARDEAKETPQQRQADRERRNTFVRPGVKELANTTRIIDRIMPRFEGVRATVISGYLNDADLFWKVNYHWELLCWMLDEAIRLASGSGPRAKLEQIRSSLRACSPDPDSGYRESPTVGKPVDRSSQELFDRRYQAVKQAKVDFKAVLREDDIVARSKRDEHAFDLAVAPVAYPGSSKHATGYALDIAGDNARISAVAKSCGASLVFDEKSHVHVEFKNGA